MSATTTTTAVRDWIKALRSQDFRQGEGKLHTTMTAEGCTDPGDLFCCLGVACELYRQADGFELDSRPYCDDDEGPIFFWEYDGQTELPPWHVADHFGLTDTTGSFKTNEPMDNPLVRKALMDHAIREGLVDGPNDHERYVEWVKDKALWSLTSLNDSDVPFAVIADVIEAAPAGLFKDEVRDALVQRVVA